MKTIEFKSNYASFTYRMTAEVGEDLTEATEALCMEGVSNLCYRVAGSAVDKALGVKSKKNGGQGRDGITFDAKHIPTIESAVSTKITELENAEGSKLGALKLSFAVTGEYVKGENNNGITKAGEKLWTQVQGLKDPAQFAKVMVGLGLDVEDYDDEKGVKACTERVRKDDAEARAAAEKARNEALGL